MGTRNRERRKAKQRAREQHYRERQQREHQCSGRPGGAPDPADLVETVVVGAVLAIEREDDAEFERCVEWLAELPVDDSGADRDLAGTVLFGCLQRAVAAQWLRGWQPQDLARLVDRLRSARHTRLAVDMIVAELRNYAPATVDERWDTQLATLGAGIWWERDSEYLTGWGVREKLDRTAVMRHAVQVLQVIGRLPELPRLCPPPGAARRGALRSAGSGAGAGADQRMLAKVRALLAKAESTEFAEEADAFTAKAQELMARYSIDYALLAATAPTNAGRDEPAGIRVAVDNPYESAKSTLLAQVASANRCKAVWSTHFGFSTVLGFPADLESVEMLYTSLLVQATAAMMREGSRTDRYGRSRTRSFRQSFLNAYALRIGERLREASEEVSRTAARETGRERLLPVLAARDEAVREATETMFPELVTRRLTVGNLEGWASGTAAADQASLHTRAAVTEPGR